MAIVAITGTPDVLGQLPTIGSQFRLTLAGGTATDNGDGTWTVTGQTAEANIPALTGLGCTVVIAVSDADELARWQVIDTQIDNEPPVA
ncbi:MAG TPA: hypothetical protein VMV17_01335 [Streptosporangiaceae bacterium]|jgi:hypothetical protein|nr:hypothetical protein [Streptosporangiaceae bacterium]